MIPRKSTMGVCTYIDKKINEQELLKWIGWYRHVGVSCFYLYVSESVYKSTQKTLGQEIHSVFLLIAPDELTAYNDCLYRARYICEYVAFLNIGEFLQAKNGDVAGSIEKQMAGANRAGLYIDLEDYPRCILRPLAVCGYLRKNELEPFNKSWAFIEANGLFLAPPARRIAMLSHVLAKNGAPIALLSAAKILKKAGYEIDVYSASYGPLEEDFNRLGIEVTVDAFLFGTPIAEQPWYGYYDLVFVNTAVMAGCFTRPLNKAPAVWWLHEGPYALEKSGLNKEVLSVLCSDGVATTGVSHVAKDAFQSLNPSWPMSENLTLGIEDTREGKIATKESTSPMVFLTIGNIEERKGQDVLLQAIEKLSDKDRKECSFLLVGKDGQSASVAYIQNIKGMIFKYPEIKVLPPIAREDLMALYGKVDAVIVPSREETLSMVAIEAMMTGIPCILSSNAGVAEYTTNKKDAFVFGNENPDELASILHDVINNRKLLKEMKKPCRRLYEKEFSSEKFEKNLLELVDRSIRKQEV